MFRTSRVALATGIRSESMVRCTDSSGIIKAKVVGFHNNRWIRGTIGRKCFIQVRDATSSYNGPAGIKAICARTKATKVRRDGSWLRFSENAVVPLAKNSPLGAAVKGPIPLECIHSLRNVARWVL